LVTRFIRNDSEARFRDEKTPFRASVQNSYEEVLLKWPSSEALSAPLDAEYHHWQSQRWWGQRSVTDTIAADPLLVLAAIGNFRLVAVENLRPPERTLVPAIAPLRP
jgi:hypothetical protein